MAARFSSARLRTFTEDTKVGNTQNDSQIVLIMVNLNSKIKHTNIKMTQKINGIEMKGFISMIHLLMPQRSQEQLRNLRERISTLAEQHPDAGHPQNSQKEGKEVVSHNRDKSNSPGLSMLVVQPKLDNFAGMDQDVGSEHRVDPVVQTPSHVDLSRYPNVGNHHSDLSFESSAAKNFEHSIIEGNSTVLHRSKGFERLVKEMKAYFDCKEDGLVGWFLDLDEDGDGLVTAGELLDEIHTMRCDVDKEAAAELVGILTDEDIKAISLSHFWKFFMLPDQRLHHIFFEARTSHSKLTSSNLLGLLRLSLYAVFHHILRGGRRAPALDFCRAETVERFLRTQGRAGIIIATASRRDQERLSIALEKKFEVEGLADTKRREIVFVFLFHCMICVRHWLKGRMI
ncbi:hypothetical protein GUITHDRAFT_134604 [Guillardia theta CCMP2712]|uniref:EF-hand domain-containing protein n=1 Tax=Guillardia theta (strain CCMP2712) TaxID=905079 RepID=L1JRJ5_GUITC|nr:hypothetical protein GUITHDRAFT_134604 [Guillardia theta CCMP2712]EKX51077.1 hypothetical protein GUITHDRAFT_134604 [Guillardia theta CCMP2712]|eukprot:XP_005838057.1 hypothetical protein GUITHDRAFT_134604 [Guillardia theta CCMP2712]